MIDFVSFVRPCIVDLEGHFYLPQLSLQRKIPRPQASGSPGSAVPSQDPELRLFESFYERLLRANACFEQVRSIQSYSNITQPTLDKPLPWTKQPYLNLPMRNKRAWKNILKYPYSKNIPTQVPTAYTERRDPDIL